MANNVGNGINRVIQDVDGEAATVTNNRLDVNAVLSASDNIEIGNVDIKLNGTAVSGGADDVDNGTLRVTIAGDDAHFGAVGASSDADGVIHAQLRFLSDVIGTSGVTGPSRAMSIAGTRSAGQLRELLSDSDGHLQIDVISAPSTAVTNAGTFAVQSTLQAGSATIGKLAANSGVDIGDVDVTSISAGTNAIGKVGHDITGGADGVTTVSTAGTDVVLASSTACKKVDIQAQTDNTGLIAVGFTGVDATEATGTGIILYAGDVYSLEISNLNLIYIDATENGEGVRYTYFT